NPVYEGDETFTLTGATEAQAEANDSKSGTATIQDTEDNPPKAEDFTAAVESTGKTQVVFETADTPINTDPSDTSTDHISDAEDDAAGVDPKVVIVELPDHGQLFYKEGGEFFPVEEEHLLGGSNEKHFDANSIHYEPDADSEGFILGVKDAELSEAGASNEEFLNWGDATSDSNVRTLDLGNGHVVTITSNGDLFQHMGDPSANHVGYGIGVNNDKGIDKNDSISIDFGSRPATSVTLGLDGVGGWFHEGLDTNDETSVRIVVHYEGGPAEGVEYTFQKSTSGDSNLFHEITIPANGDLTSGTLIGASLPDGAIITSVELGTNGNGNWELRYLETEATDSFDYRAVDSDGNMSETKTVTVDESNGSLEANNDPQGFEVKLGEYSDDNSSPWTDEGVALSASFNGQDKAFAHDGIKIGVAGQVGGLGAQIEYDRDEQISEKFEINLDKPATQFTFSVSNLFENEGNDGGFTDNHEQGRWVAYLDGIAVASDTFVAEGKGKGTYEIIPKGPDGAPIAFDSVVFEATEYSNRPTHDNDASDYFLTGFKASSEGAYAVNQGGILTIPASQLAGINGSELLDNDFDSDGDSLRITYVYGETEGNAYIKDGVVYFDLTGDDFVGETTFKYQITDDNGEVASATVNVIVNPQPTASNVASVDLLADSVLEGDDLGFKVTLDSSALVETKLDVTFGKDSDDAKDSGNEKDLDLSKVRFTNGVTYDEQSGKLIVPVGVKDFAVLIPTLVDGVHELDESYSLNVGGVSDTGIIENVDSTTLTVESVADVAEGSKAVFSVSLSNPSSENIDVSLAISLDGDATSAEQADFKDISELFTAYYLEPQLSGEPLRVELEIVTKDGKPTVTIPNGETEIFVEVATKDDSVFEGAEDFTLVVTDESGYVSNDSASDEATILDDGTDPDGPQGPQVGNDDRPVVERISDIEIEEGKSGTFVVELSNSSELKTTIEMSLNDGSAVSVDGQPTEGDFNASSVIVTFGEGANKQSETVEVINGKFVVSVPEGHESFTVQVATNQDAHSDNNEKFSISGNATHQQDAVTGVATIVDNEAPMVDLNGALYDIEYVSEGAGYSNVFGYYIYDEESDTQQLHVLISNNNDPSLEPGTLLDSPLSSIDNLEFFLIPNGFSKIASEDLNKLELNDQGQLVVDGEVKSRIPVYKSTDEDHQISTTVDANGNLVLSFDDQKGQGNDDNDFNDIVIKVSKVDTDGINFDSSYVEGGEAAIADIDADVFDDKDVIQSMNVTLTNAKDGDNLTWAENSGFNVVKTVTGTSIALVITHPSGSVSANEFEAFLKSIRFVNSSDTPDEETRLVDVTVSDGVNQSETATASISVTDTDELSFNNVAGLEDRFIDLNISVADAATSVSTIELSGIPQGATVVVDGVESTVGNSGLIVVGIDDIDSVKVKAPEHSDVNFEITVTAKDGNNVVETGSIYVDVHPDADKPILKIGDFEKVAAIDFEDVVLNHSGHPSWDSGIAINDVAGAGTIGEWKTSNAGQHVEVGTEGTYLSGSSTNQVMEIEGEVGDKVLYTDMDLVAGRFYNFQFDIAARNDVDPSDSDMEVSLYKLDDFGNPIADSKVTLYDFIAERVGDGWQKGTFTLPVEDSGKYRLVLEADEADSTGAIIDNIQFTAVDNYGYEDSFIKLSEISASLVDVEDGSETLTIELQGLPVGAVLIDGTGPNTNKYIVTETNKNDKIDVTDWNLAQLQVKVLDPSTFDIKVIATATESDTNKDDDVHVDHGDLGGKLTNASEATINVTVLERPQGPVDTNALPTTADFSLSSDHSVVEVNFERHAEDVEDNQDDNKFTQVKLAELPEHGDLYYLDSTTNKYVKVTEDMITGDNPLLFNDNTKVYYVATDAPAVTQSVDANDFVSAIPDQGITELSVNGMSISGGNFIDGGFVQGDAKIKYDPTNKQQGVYVSTDDNQGRGDETGVGEYISISSIQGSMSSAELHLVSIQGLLGPSAHAHIVAYTYSNGEMVGRPIELNIEVPHPNPNHAGTATVTSSYLFDEIRLVVVSDTGTGAGFNLAGVDMIGIKDDFTYWAVDSDNQQSQHKGTVHLSASSKIEAANDQIDDVRINHSGSEVDWAKSAATIWGSESNGVVEYDQTTGMKIDVGNGNDIVQLGSGDDTIFLGESHSQVEQQVDAFDTLLDQFASSNINETEFYYSGGNENSVMRIGEKSVEGLDIAQGGGGNDHIYGEGGSDIIFGGTGHDYLDGGIGNDAVRGGSGDDIIIGGEGNDFLTGDSGEDIFQFIDQGAGIRDGEVDRITDFTKGVDKIDISDLLQTDENDTIDSLLTSKEIGLAVNGSDLTLTLSERGDDVGERSQQVVIEGGANQYSDYISGSSITDTNAILNDLLKVYDTTNH
ncbi:Ig-like domain-containing protein, partial [Vibrio brasiliensis]